MADAERLIQLPDGTWALPSEVGSVKSMTLESSIEACAPVYFLHIFARQGEHSFCRSLCGLSYGTRAQADAERDRVAALVNAALAGAGTEAPPCST
jgi:hypothetical protein